MFGGSHPGGNKLRQLVKTSLVIFAAASIVAAVFAVGATNSASAITTLYQIDFEDPPHVAGNPPATGSGAYPRDTVSIDEGSSIIVAGGGAPFTSQYLEVYHTAVEVPLKFVGLSFDITADRYGALSEVTVFSGDFQIRFPTDVGGDAVIIFSSDGNIYSAIAVKGGETPVDIGDYTPGSLVTVGSDMDTSTNTWNIYLDGGLAQSRSFNGATVVTGMMFRAIKPSADVSAVSGIDNVEVSVETGPVEEPITPTIEVVSPHDVTVMWGESFDIELAVTAEPGPYFIRTITDFGSFDTDYDATGSPDDVMISVALPKEAAGDTHGVTIELHTNPPVATNTDVSVTVEKRPTTITLDSVGTPFWGASVDFTGTVADAGPSPTPTGAFDGPVSVSGTGVGDGVTPASGTADTDGTFSVPGTIKGAPAVTGLDATATYDGNDFYTGSSSSAVSFDTAKHPTSMAIDPISDTLWGNPLTVSGTIFDTAFDPEGAMPAGTEISLSGDGLGTVPATALSGSPWSASGLAPSPPEPTGGPKTVTAEYLGDSSYDPSGPLSTEYATLPHATTLSGLGVPSSAKWYYAYLGTGTTLTDNDSYPTAGAPVSGRTITFDGGDVFLVSGVLGSTTGTTGVDGVVPPVTLVAPQNIGADKIVEASFAGDSDYIGDDTTATLEITKHVTALTLPSLVDGTATPLTGIKWFYEFFAAGVTLTDSDAAGASTVDTSGSPISTDPTPTDETITFGGSAVDSPPIPTGTTDADGVVSPPQSLIASQDTGTDRGVVATYAETTLYFGTSSESMIEVLKHATSLSLADIPNTPWDLPITAAGTLTDLDTAVDPSKAALTPAGVSGKTIGISGTRAGPPITADKGTLPDSTLTTTGGSYSAGGNAPFAPRADGFTLTTSFAGDSGDGPTALYLGSTSPTDAYDTLKHDTLLDLNFVDESINPADPDFISIALFPPTTDIESAFPEARFAIGGTLIDTTYTPNVDVGFTGQDTSVPITFAGTGASTLPDAFTEAIIFEHASAGGIEIEECTIASLSCSEDKNSVFGDDPDGASNKVIKLKVGGMVMFPEDTIDAFLYIQDSGASRIDYKVTMNNGAFITDSVIGEDACGAGPPDCGDYVIPILKAVSGNEIVGGVKVAVGIESIEILAVDPDGDGPAGPDPDGQAGIAAMVVHAIDGRNPVTRTYALSFENEITGIKSSPFESHTGAFTSIGTAQPTEEQNRSITADYAGDGNYEPSTSATGAMDIIHNTAPAGLTGAGFAAVAETADEGAAFTVPECAEGGDIDNDDVCDNWESNGLVDFNGANYPVVDASTDTRDIFVELDAQSGNSPTETTINQLKGIFETGPAIDGRPYVLHLDYSTIETVGVTNAVTHVWTDDSSAWLSGTPTYTVTDGDGTVANPRLRIIDVTGLSLRGTGIDINNKLELKIKVVFGDGVPDLASDDPVSITFLAASSVVGYGTGISSVTPPDVTSLTASTVPGEPNARILTATVTFTTTGEITDDVAGTLGTINIRFNVGSGAPATAATITGNSRVSTASGGMVITQNDDFNGIKRSYFGTPQERLDAGGGLGQETPNMIAKLAFYHYALSMRNSASSITGCGASGFAEIGGNDFIISLGQRRVDTNADGVLDTNQNCYGGANGSVDQWKGTFLHELGHNLGLLHGGNTDDNCKPNYHSVMSYARQFAVGGFSNVVPDYSREALVTFDERLQANGGVGITESNGNGLVINEADLDGLNGPDNYPNYLGDGVTPFYTLTNANGRIIYLVTGNGIGSGTQRIIDDVPSAINFNGGSTTTLYGYDINYISSIPGCNVVGSLTVLNGFNDWTNLDLTATDGTSADAITLPVTDAATLEEIQGLLEDHNDGTVTPLDPIELVEYDGSATVPSGTQDVTKRANMPVKFRYLQLNGQSYTPTTPTTLTSPPTTLIFISADKINFVDTDGDGIKDAVVRTPYQVVATGGTIGYRYDANKDYWIFDLNTKMLANNALYGIYAVRIVDLNEDGIITADDYDLNGDGIVDNGIALDFNTDGYMALVKKGIP